MNPDGPECGYQRLVNPAVAAFLVSPDGRALLEDVAVLPGDAAERVLALRKRRPNLPGDITAAAVEVADARHRARLRFPDAARLFFTADALAQATAPAVAAYHAAGLARFGAVADLGCGVGMDSLALAEAGASVAAVERDAARLVFARANAQERHLADRITFLEDDVTALSWLPAAAAFWDPSRRIEGRGRRVSLHADRYEPPLSFLEAVRPRVRGGCVKLSPALPDDVLDTLNGRVEFLSERGVCKEACLWFGEAAGAAGDVPRHAAVLLPEKVVVFPDPDEVAPVGPLAAFIHDPDPALVRANALGAAADRLKAHLVSPDDAYLTGDTPADESRLAASYRVTDALPYKPRILRDLLRARGIARLVVKKRHFPHEPDAVLRDLGLRPHAEGREATLILVRRGKEHLAVLCAPDSPRRPPA